MTESEWRTCIDPHKMLEFVQGKASDRKLRLFAVACSRRHRHLTRDSRVTDALAVAERFADGLVGDVERSNARKAAQEAAEVRGVVARGQAPKWERRVASLAYYATARQAADAVSNLPGLAEDVLIWRAGGHNACDWQAIKTAESKVLSDLLRDIFGNPFRPVTVAPAILVWKANAIPQLAQAIYEERAFDRLPVLADALRDAGCDNSDILEHCQATDLQHTRGCWLLDLLLGKS